MKVVCCGSREWKNKDVIRKFFDKHERDIDMVIEGGARGADALCYDEAVGRGIATVTAYPNWDYYGKSAGAIRNRTMLDLEPDMVVAFHDALSTSKGTRDTVREAERREIETLVIGENYAP